MHDAEPAARYLYVLCGPAWWPRGGFDSRPDLLLYSPNVVSRSFAPHSPHTTRAFKASRSVCVEWGAFFALCAPASSQPDLRASRDGRRRVSLRCIVCESGWEERRLRKILRTVKSIDLRPPTLGTRQSSRPKRVPWRVQGAWASSLSWVDWARQLGGQ